MATKELAKRPGQAIDPEQEPSVDWGWHGGFPHGTQIAGWFSVFMVLAMLFGNHQGLLSGTGEVTTADLWLIGTAVVLAIGLLTDLRRRRRLSWRR